MKTKELHLLAFHVALPRNPMMTRLPGYMKNPDNIRYEERLGFSRGLKPRDQCTASIILNLNKKTVLRNRFNPQQKDFDSLFKYFLKSYPDYVAKVMSELDPKYLEQFVPAANQGKETPDK
jgi:hypothetical protein